MSNGETEPGISDEQLPDDLQPSEDNPLAEGLDDGESAGDLLDEGKGAEGDQADQADQAEQADPVDPGDAPDTDGSEA